MPLSYHWNPNSLQIICEGRVHMLPVDDARYPWALVALSQSERAVLDVLNGDIPLFMDRNTQWTTSFLPEHEDASNDAAWEMVDVLDDYAQACSVACDYLLTNTDAERVRVVSNSGEEIFALSRKIKLATS